MKCLTVIYTDLLVYSHNILKRLKNYFCQLLNAVLVNDDWQTGVCLIKKFITNLYNCVRLCKDMKNFLTSVYLTFIVMDYDIPKSVEQCRVKLREEFEKNRHITDIRVIDMLVIKVGVWHVLIFCSLTYRRLNIMNYKFQILNSGGWTIRPPATWNTLPQHEKPLFYSCLLLFRSIRLWIFLLHMKHANYYLTCLFVHKNKLGHGGKASHILDFRTRWKWMVRFMFWPLLSVF